MVCMIDCDSEMRFFLRGEWAIINTSKMSDNGLVSKKYHPLRGGSNNMGNLITED